MMPTAFDARHLVGPKALNFLWNIDNRVVVASVVEDTALAVIVESPGPYIVLFVNGKGVVCAGGDVFDLFLGKSEFAGSEASCAHTFHDTTTKLVLLTAAPSKDPTILIKSEDMIGTAGNVFDFFEAWNAHGRLLHVNVFGETEDTFIALRDVSAGMWEILIKQLTLNVPHP